MTRSDAVREEVKRLDGYRCQVCGAGAETAVLEVHHVRPLGLGGSVERDTVENCITLCGQCHHDVTNGKRWIQIWDRAAGLFVWCDQLHKPMDVPLWFHRRRDAERGEAITTRLTAYALIDRDVAEDAFELRSVYKAVDPEAKSFPAYLAERGIDPRLAKAAALYGKSRECGLEWGAGVTATDYRRQLKDAGKVEARTFLALVFRDAETVKRLVNAGDIGFMRRTDDQLADMGCECVRAGKLFKISKEQGDLVLRDGTHIAVDGNKGAIGKDGQDLHEANR